VLNVAYPFVRLTPDQVGGAEQVLMHLDRALLEAGYRSLLIAPEGSQSLGELIPIKANTTSLSEKARRETEEAVRTALAVTCREQAVDVALESAQRRPRGRGNGRGGGEVRCYQGNVVVTQDGIDRGLLRFK